ncbi:hypothetical protein MPH_13018 [Macrophomina phaseolina MS6]|uniref:Uncharacterized protein n=2 Tax=Macrophomina phaseolina TaxID=35725 RepID=K2RZM7_MACPH|nr:hypothetical protein MPH_13018 [Macrophomina phaseolina MS6]
MPIYVLPTLLALLLFALARSLIATVYSFVDFNTANALALVWDGETATRPRFFTPETYAANQGWGDTTSPEVAARARAARICCAVLTVLTGLAALLAFAIWRRERMGRDHERVSSVADDADEVERKEVGGREVVEMEDRGRAELGAVKGDGGMHEASGRPLHEMEAGAGAHEVEGRYLCEVEGTHAHEMAGDEGRRMVYEMDASEPAQRKEREEGERKWEQWP